MKKSYLTLFILIGISLSSLGQTNVQVDANDVVTSNNKLIIQTGYGQSFFTGHQLGGGYAFPDGIFRAIADNATGSSNYFFDGVKWNGSSYVTNFSIRADGQAYFAGNMGIGTTSPSAKLSVIGGSDATSLMSLGASSNADFSGSFSRSRLTVGNTAGASSALLFYGRNHSSNALEYKWEIGSDLFMNGANDLYFCNPLSPNVFPLYINSSGNLGVATTSPTSDFQVQEGCTKASIGEADGADLNFGTSYLGFNAARNTSLKQWTISTDQVHNGGGVIYSNILGEIYFAPVASTGATDQTLSDTDIKNKITFRVAADGVTYAKKIKVELTNWPDYVFKPAYSLMPLTDVKSYIDKNHHLPDMPSADQMEKNGLDLGEMNKLLTKKMEEMTLYLIEKDKEMKQQQEELKQLQEQVRQLIKAGSKN